MRKTHQKVNIREDDLSDGIVIALLEEHLADMYATSPPESVHALDVEALRSDSITFFSAWIDNQLAGCIALSQLDEEHAEIKSMRTSKMFRCRGIASTLLEYLLEVGKARKLKQISLETGTQDYFLAARNLYRKYGFQDCGPFNSYTLDPNSQFMTLRLK